MNYAVVYFKSETAEPLIERLVREYSDIGSELLKIGSVYVNQKRADPAAHLNIGDLVRVHTNPRRYPIRDFDWKARILFENDDLLAVNKPSFVPCHPTVDNIEENIKKIFEGFLGQYLWIGQRLDLGTTGCLVLFKNLNELHYLNKELRSGRVQKYYDAWTRTPPPVGILEHRILSTGRAPVQAFERDDELGKPAKLEVLEVSQDHELGIYKSKIQLFTGRTHQIRAQLARVGHPLVGDLMYGDSCGDDQMFALHCRRLRWSGRAQSYDITAHSDDEWRRRIKVFCSPH